LLLMVNTCSAVVEFDISPGTKYVRPGETVSYDMKVFLETPIDNTVEYPVTEYFSIDPKLPDWGYSFSEDSVMLDLTRIENFSVLTITVPLDAGAGSYSHEVNATGYDESNIIIDEPIEIDIYVINTNVQVPEFPTVALPMLAVFGLVAIFGKRKNKV